MGIQTIRRVVCDKCDSEINTDSDAPRWVDATDYGKTFHEVCLKNVNGLDLIKLLELDDITFNVGDAVGPKVCYAQLNPPRCCNHTSDEHDGSGCLLCECNKGPMHVGYNPVVSN